MTKQFGALKKDVHDTSNKERAKTSLRFFKTGPGEYGEGDLFFGITAKESRKIAKKYSDISLREVEALLRSRVHEERFIALLILVEKYKREDSRDVVYRVYLKNTQWINNWDLVDVSADKIVGAHLFSRKKDDIYRLARSKSLWEKRIAMIATFYFIRKGVFIETLKIAEILMNDTHDLIHKAVGWMLREVGNRSRSTEEEFLKKYYAVMPRTMLRYAIEKFPEIKRKRYLKKVLK